MQTLSVKKQKPPVSHETGGFCGDHARNGRERTQQNTVKARCFYGMDARVYYEKALSEPGDFPTSPLIRHSPSRSHFDMTPGRRYTSEICDGQVRLPIGIEDADDLIADLEQALAQI